MTAIFVDHFFVFLSFFRFSCICVRSVFFAFKHPCLLSVFSASHQPVYFVCLIRFSVPLQVDIVARSFVITASFLADF